MIETMQKRINEIKQQDRKSYYEIANEIGISESTLYNLMSKSKLFTPADQKITAYLRGYLTKDEQLEAYRLDNEELKAENDRLKAPSMIMPKVKQLAVPIDEYQKALKILTEGLNKRQMILQEIKTIVETCLSGVNCTECPLTNECKTDHEIDALGVCQMILQKITKAEEE